ncbi:MAG TPA: putative Ig domain-containing protein [Methanoregula sp.]|nr:putative Ig domain-containing protein [Methanoregula sp.]
MSDGSLSASTTATIVVAGASQVQPPVITPIPSQQVNPGNQLTLNVQASSPGGKSLTYSAANIPSRAVFRPATHDFLWVPAANQAGSYKVTFMVSDGTKSSSVTVTMVVAGSSPQSGWHR